VKAIGKATGDESTSTRGYSHLVRVGLCRVAYSGVLPAWNCASKKPKSNRASEVLGDRKQLQDDVQVVQASPALACDIKTFSSRAGGCGAN
jgi:hypothetical protein